MRARVKLMPADPLPTMLSLYGVNTLNAARVVLSTRRILMTKDETQHLAA